MKPLAAPQSGYPAHPFPRLVARLLGTVLGCGYSPIAPGTVGSLAALLVAYYLQSAFDFAAMHFAAMSSFLLIPAIWSSHVVALQVNREDPGVVVIDEVMGQWIALSGLTTYNWKAWAGAFVVFRILDVVKPPPARQFERLTGGVGIVLDDVMAGLYGALVLFAAGCFNLY